MLSGRRAPVMGAWYSSTSAVSEAPIGAIGVVSLLGECHIVQIVVRDNNVDQALKALKKKMQREGLFREMKRRNHFEKPSEKKAREKAEAVRRARKLARKRAQREGLLPKT
jgi:small subunit ribosomal protein S21